MEHIELLQKLLVVLFTVSFFWKLITYMWSFLNVEKEPVIVLVTGAAGMLKPIFFFLLAFFKEKISFLIMVLNAYNQIIQYIVIALNLFW